MKKNLKYFILAVLVIVLIALIYLVISGVKQNKNIKDDSLKVLTPEQTSQQQTADQQIVQQTVQKVQAAAQKANSIASSAPVLNNISKVEFMTDAEKTTLNIPIAAKAQVLSREESGLITAYKIIKKDSDIVTK